MTRANAKKLALKSTLDGVRRHLIEGVTSCPSGFGVCYSVQGRVVHHIGLSNRRNVMRLIRQLARKGHIGVGFRTKYTPL